MPPRWRNHRDPTGPDTPTATAASSLVNPSAILSQKARSTSRRGGGRPGDRIGARPVLVDIHAAVRPIVTPLLIGVLRRPLESALGTALDGRRTQGEHPQRRLVSARAYGFLESACSLRRFTRTRSVAARRGH